MTSARIPPQRPNAGSIGVSAALSSTTYNTLELRASGQIGGPGGISVPSLILTDGSATNRTYAIDGSTEPNSVQQSPALLLPCTATSLTINGGSGNDTFNVKAGTTTTISLYGNNPSTAPGDTLNYNAQVRAVAGDTTAPSGSITSPTVQPVNFQGIETVNFTNFIPLFTIDDVNVVEGDSGTTNAVFTVSLSVASPSPISVDFAAAGTATSGTDYTATAGTLTFAHGIIAPAFSVPIINDATIAPLTTPALTGVTFFPGTTDVTVNTSNLDNINFTASFTVTGKVSNSSGVGIPNIQVTRKTPTTSVTAFTNVSGIYTFTGMRSGSYTITPSKSGTNFNSLSKNVTVGTANVTNINFIGS